MHRANIDKIEIHLLSRPPVTITSSVYLVLMMPAFISFCTFAAIYHQHGLRPHTCLTHHRVLHVIHQSPWILLRVRQDFCAVSLFAIDAPPQTHVASMDQP